MRLSRLVRCAMREFLGRKVDYYSEFTPSSLSIQQYVEFGRNGDQRSSFNFLRKELLVRLANIMQEISLLPTQLLKTPSCSIVQDWYQRSFSDVLEFETLAAESQTLHAFNETLSSVLKRHSTVVETMAEGLVELKTKHGVDVPMEPSLQYFLDRFYINRISIRTIMNQHLLLFSSLLPDNPRHVGAIDPLCDVLNIVEEAYENARFLCDRYYLRSPNLKIESKNAINPMIPISIVYVPSHLYHIMFELFKNAMRAETEFYNEDADLPDLKVFIMKGKEDLSIKLCDRGGGVPRSIVDMMFNYMYTTAPPPIMADRSQAPLAGYGYGLPLSRLYARYFHGDLFLVSMEGYGTDACVYLKALAPEASELLPIYSTSSKRHLTMKPQARDWSQRFQGVTLHGAQPHRA